MNHRRRLHLIAPKPSETRFAVFSDWIASFIRIAQTQKDHAALSACPRARKLMLPIPISMKYVGRCAERPGKKSIIASFAPKWPN
jgi:hypothetical protein